MNAAAATTAGNHNAPEWEGERGADCGREGGGSELSLLQRRGSRLGETPISNDWRMDRKGAGAGGGGVLCSLAFHPQLLKGNTVHAKFQIDKKWFLPAAVSQQVNKSLFSSFSAFVKKELKEQN